MPNILINFEITQTGGAEVLDSLAATGKVEQSLADNTKKANAALSDQQKKFTGAATGAQELAVATGNVAKSIAGGAFSAITKSIDQLTSKTANSTERFGQLYKAVTDAKTALAKLDPNSADFKTLNTEIQAAETALSGFNSEATSGRARLAQYRNTLLQLEEAGLEGTQVFQDLAVQAGDLGDAVGDTQARIAALGSDTFGFDVALGAVQGLAGGFAVAQGAAALFGSESEDVQKALLKVNAAMSILQGLQQIQNLLQAQSSLYLGAQIALQRLSALQTNLQAAAESRFIVVRYAAIIAQRLLNAVMAANPAGIALLAIGALAGVLLLLTSNTDDASEAQKKLNEQLEFSIKLNEQAAKVAQQTSNVQLATLQKNRADAQTIRDAEAQGLRDQVVLVKDSYDRATAVVKSYGDDVSKLSKDEIANRLEALKIQQDTRQKYFDLENQLQVRRIQNQKAAEDDALKSATAAAEARISQATKDSAAELAASIAAIQVRQKEELAAEGLTNGERIKIIAENERAIAELRQQIRAKGLQDQLALLQASAIREKDTYKKLQKDIEVVLLQAQLDTIGKNAAQATLIEAQRDEAIRALRKDHYDKLTTIDTAFYTGLTAQDQDSILKHAKVASEHLSIEQAKNQAEIDSANKAADEKKKAYEAVRDVALSTASSLAGSLNEINANQTEAQISELQRQLDAKLITQNQYDRAVRKLQHDQAVREKQTAIFQAGISLSQAILKVLADKTIPLPLQGLYIALNTAAALAQIAAINSKPIPAYAEGTKNAKGGKSLVGEAGAELIYDKGRMSVATKATIVDLSPGAKVLPAFETEKILQAYNIPVPAVPKGVSQLPETFNIDYNKLGRIISTEIGKIPFSSTELTERGLHRTTSSISARNKFLQSRYKSN